MDKVDLTGTLSEDCKSIILDFSGVMPRVLRNFKDKKLLLKLSIFRKKRSDAQNRYLHGVICIRVRSWHKHTQGEEISNDEAKAYIYSHVLGHELRMTNILGQYVFVMEGKHFSQMNTKEFNEAKEKVQAFFSPLGCDIPDPREECLITNYID